MLQIIVMILKIIGMILLALLLLVLLVTAAVLFVPVRYRVNGTKEEDGSWIRAEAFWFLHLLRIKAVYPKPGRTTIRLLCFTLYDSDAEPREKKKKKKHKKEPSSGEVQKTGKKKKADIPEKEQNEQAESIQGQLEDLHLHVNSPEEMTEDKNYPEEREESIQKETGRIGQFLHIFIEKTVEFFEKIKDILRKIKKAAENIWYTIKRLCDRIVKIREDIAYYIEVFGEEETEQAFLLCRRELAKVWNNIRPSKCSAELLIGTGEPDTTGYILAVHGILYPVIGNDIRIEPDFENQVLAGKFVLKGRITVFVLLHAVIKIYFDKNIRYFLKRFKREEA